VVGALLDRAHIFHFMGIVHIGTPFGFIMFLDPSGTKVERKPAQNTNLHQLYTKSPRDSRAF
jgi:hypothetical protein